MQINARLGVSQARSTLEPCHIGQSRPASARKKISVSQSFDVSMCRESMGGMPSRSLGRAFEDGSGDDGNKQSHGPVSRRCLC